MEMEEAIEEEEKEEGTHIPIDILNEIFARLPLKSLATFMSVSKLWYDSIDLIIDRLQHKELHRRVCRYHEFRRALEAMSDKSKQLVTTDDLCKHYAGMKAKVDEMLSVLDFDPNMEPCANRLPLLGCYVPVLTRDLAYHAEKLLGETEHLIDVANAFEDWAALN